MLLCKDENLGKWLQSSWVSDEVKYQTTITKIPPSLVSLTTKVTAFVHCSPYTKHPTKHTGHTSFSLQALLRSCPALLNYNRRGSRWRKNSLTTVTQLGLCKMGSWVTDSGSVSALWLTMTISLLPCYLSFLAILDSQRSLPSKTVGILRQSLIWANCILSHLQNTGN